MQKTNLNISPIFDDFDESKNFHRVLFNAGKAVQARELTQAQTILQSQIERMGKHLFAEGAMVVPGGIRAIESQDVIKITLNGGSLYSDFSSETELYVKHSSTGMIYKVAKTFDAVGADPISLFVDLIAPGSGQEKKFLVNDQITLFVYTTGGAQLNLALGMVTAVTKGAWTKVQRGVYFVRGMFIATEDQDYVVSKYTTDATLKVGFLVNEEIITAANDITLYSNANGFVNQNAEGASRLKITLTLSGLAVGAANPNFIELAKFENGKLQSKVESTDYSILEDSLARRTYETHGDYVVEQFGMDLKEHLKSGDNGGVYTVEAGGDETKLAALLKPGVAYVKGYRVQNIGIQTVAFDKARDTAFLNNASQGADYGQYFLVNNLASLPEIDIKKKINLLDSGSVQIGTARVRALRKDGSEYRVYVFDLSLNTGKTVANVAKIRYTDASNLVTADLVSSVLFDASRSSLVFNLPINAVETLYTPGVGGDTSYVVSRSFNLTTNGSGVVSASVNANETFDLVSNDTYFIALTGAATPGTQFVPVSTITLGGNPNGSSLTIDLGVGQANKTIRLVAPVIKNETTQKSKTLQTVTDEVVAFVTTNQQKLTKADVYKIVSVKDNTTSEDITAQYTFDSGQRDSWYESGKLIVANRVPQVRTVKVTYQYFEHSAGDYFSIDSYGAMNREDIPVFNGVYLADCIDFRPLKDAAGDFTSLTVFGEMIRPGNSIRADISYYLPRRDLIVVYSDGSFGAVRGESSLTPELPEVPTNALKLYELYIPAFTYDPSDVVVRQVDNRRYTMRDIGKLEARIANVEYYTTLSALENKTNKTQVIDPVTGNNRFKNGFAVDGFQDFRLADLDSPEWSASMDLAEGRLQPQFVENGADFLEGALSLAGKRTRVYMKNYTEAVVVDQPYATGTINVNPYAVFTWVGKVTLNPDRDFWKDVKYTQPIVINNVVNLRGDAVQGTVWNSWSNSWSAARNELGIGGWQGGRQLIDTIQGTTTTSTTTTFTESTSSSSNDALVSTEVMYFMRTIDVRFECTGFRPFTRIYPFFDGVNVSTETKQDGKNYGDSIITDANGKATGIFTIPNRSDMRFKTGTSVLRFTDSATDARGPEDTTTAASAVFTSAGTQDNRQVTTTNTTVLSLNRTSSTSTASRVIATQDITPVWNPIDFGGGGDGGGDPIAQTFMVMQRGGSFVSKVDIYFATKAASIPVTLELRTVIAGLPSSDVIAFVTLNPDQVSTSENGTTPTSFVFNDPVYLEQGVEYAIVLKAETQDYTVYIAELGKNVIGQNMALSKQAYIGVFLTSSNASTWSPDQNRDMKFRVHRAVFNTGTSTVTFDAKAPVAQPLGFNAVSTVSGSGTVVVNHKSHGQRVGDSITIAGAVGGNGLSAGDINGTKTVTAATIDTFSFAAGANATATGTVGGSLMTVVSNYPFNMFVNNVASFTPPGCEVDWEYSYRSQATRVMSGWIPMLTFRTTQLAAEGVVKAQGDLQIRATLKTDRDNLSPCIESSGFNAVLITPRVDATSKVFNYVSQEIKFDNPTTHARFIVGARLPGTSGMKLYVKEIDTADQDVAATEWVELQPTNPVTNSDSFVEYEYLLEGSFIGYKLKVELTGVNTKPPSLLDIRTLAFA
jgi:hypothetical protein